MAAGLRGVRLRDLPAAARLGITCMVVVLAFGLATSAAHLVAHHEKRDERPGLSLDDVRGAYHGIRTRAPLRVALERGHPEKMADRDRRALLAWLEGGASSETYDSLDLGEYAPAEILDRNCLSCHARNADDSIGKRVPLEYWDDVRVLAVSRDVKPTAPEILIASAHTHALAMGTLSLLVGMLSLATRFPAGLVGFLVLLSGAGLAADLGSWFLAREHGVFVWGIVGGGAAWMGGTALMLAIVLFELWLPCRREAA